MARLFVSLDIPKEIVNEIVKIQNKIKEENFFIGKFVAKENLHLTLKFLRGVKEERVSEIKNNLLKMKFEKFRIRLGKLGTFSERIFWVELLGRGVFNLQKKIDDTLSELFPKEKRFMSHITIVRIKKIKNKKGFENFVNSINYSKKGFVAKSFSLKSSILGRKGADYRTLIDIN